MNLKGDIIESTILNAKTFASLLFIYILGGGYLSVSFAAKINSIPLAIVSFFVFVIAPILFIKWLKKSFLNKIKFVFENDVIVCEIFNYQTGQIEKQYQFNYSDIHSCILSTTSKRTSTITLFLQGSNKIQYSFTNEEKEIKETDYNVSFDVFKKLHSFNKDIKLLPPFYASKSGKIALILLTTLLVVTIIVNIIFHSRSLPLILFMGVSLYFQILMRRRRDIEVFKSFKDSV